MPTDAPDGNINAHVVRGGGKKRKTANVTTADTFAVLPAEDVEAEPVKATVKKATAKK